MDSVQDPAGRLGRRAGRLGAADHDVLLAEPQRGAGEVDETLLVLEQRLSGACPASLPEAARMSSMLSHHSSATPS